MDDENIFKDGTELNTRMQALNITSPTTVLNDEVSTSSKFGKSLMNPLKMQNNNVAIANRINLKKTYLDDVVHDEPSYGKKKPRTTIQKNLMRETSDDEWNFNNEQKEFDN